MWAGPGLGRPPSRELRGKKASNRREDATLVLLSLAGKMEIAQPKIDWLLLNVDLDCRSVQLTAVCGAIVAQACHYSSPHEAMTQLST